MEQNKYAISVAVGGRITNPYIHGGWITNPAEQVLLCFAKRLRCDFAGLKQKLLNEYIYIEDVLW